MITKLNEFKKILETSVSRKNDHEIFNYRSQISDLWRPIIKKAQEFQHINFDLENNEGKEKKTIFVKKNLRKDQPVKYEFNVQLCVAGGDWECPVIYFKLEFTTEYLGRGPAKPEYVWDIKSEDSFSNKHCVIIPGPEDGNHLTKTENGYTAYDDESLLAAGLKNFKSASDEDKKKAWKWVDTLLNNLVESRHEMLDTDDTTVIGEPEPTEPVDENATTKSIIDEEKLAKLAHAIDFMCNGEYGYVYWNKLTDKIFICLGDSSPFDCESLEQYTIDILAKDYDQRKLISVEVDMECGPSRNDVGWFKYDTRKNKFLEHKN